MSPSCPLAAHTGCGMSLLGLGGSGLQSCSPHVVNLRPKIYPHTFPDFLNFEKNHSLSNIKQKLMCKNNFSGVVLDKYLSPRFLEPTGTITKAPEPNSCSVPLEGGPQRGPQIVGALSDGNVYPGDGLCEHVPPTRPQDLPLLELPSAPPMILTVCPPPRLSVTLFRQVSLSVSPHFRSSASTVKILRSQGCRGRYRSWHTTQTPAHRTFPLLQSMLPPLAGNSSSATVIDSKKQPFDFRRKGPLGAHAMSLPSPCQGA